MRYATQVRWARTLADPTVRSGLTDPAPKTRAAMAKRLAGATAAMTTATVSEMEERHPWFRALDAEHRSWVGVVARAGSFLRDGDRVRPVALAVPEPAVAAVPSPRETAEAGTP